MRAESTPRAQRGSAPRPSTTAPSHEGCTGGRGGRRGRPHSPEVGIRASWIGYIAGALTVASYMPQAVRVWRTKETHDLSWGMFVTLITAGVTWIVYGVLAEQWPVILTNAGCTLLNGVILAAKVKFR